MTNATRNLMGAAVLAVLCACGSTSNPSVGWTSNPSVVVADADELLPSESPVDWIIYADHVVRAHVVAIEKGRTSEEELKAGEGFIPRTVSLHIDETLWSRAKARPVPSNLDLGFDGWTFKGDDEYPLRMHGEPMLKAGSSYVLPIVYLEVGRLIDIPGWSNLSAATIIPMQEGVLGKGDTLAGGLDARPSIVVDVWDKSPLDLVALLESKEVPDYARPFMDLPASDRAFEIALARYGPATPGEGEH